MMDNRTTEFIDEPDTIRNEAMDDGLLMTDNLTTERCTYDGESFRREVDAFFKMKKQNKSANARKRKGRCLGGAKVKR